MSGIDQHTLDLSLDEAVPRAREVRRAATALPRELILASAGSGKTFRISSQLIRLLALGEAPDEIFASTFTRKAAGEILTRVLLRLAHAALETEAAKELGEHAQMDGRAGGCPPEFWGGVLERTVKQLHRLNIGTLDAFFMRGARSFAMELGFPAQWSIADEATRRRLRELALGDLFENVDAELLAQVVHAMAGGRATRSVHEELLRQVADLLDVHRGIDPGADGVWEGFRALANGTRSTVQERRALAERLAAAAPPLGKSTGRPTANWVNALARTAAQLHDGRWAALLGETLCEAAREGRNFDRQPMPPEIGELFEEACALARPDLAQRYADQSRALAAFAGIYETALEKRGRDMGIFGFDDITRMMGGVEPLAGRPDLFYRLDARTRHILLDEFQDTSLAQWEALEPLADELLSGYEGERAAVIVADPKQSIYGWRGGSPELVDAVRERYALATDTLARSYRSSQVILDTVNAVFDAAGALPIWSEDPAGAAEVERWSGAFSPHEAARTELSGHVRIIVGPEDGPRSRQRPNLCRRAAEEVAGLRATHPGCSIGVLTRSNGTVARLILEMERLGVPTSEEGGTPLTDAAPVSCLMALLRLADHPGNTVVRYHVARTPLGEALAYTEPNDERATRALAHRTRERLLEDGYGATLGMLAARLTGACDARERRRLGQLVELAFRYEPQATLRPSDFVRFVQAQRVEDPTPSDVRVMTVHQSKGLEFDIVVLPELDASLTRAGRGGLLPFRPQPVARVTRVFPPVPGALRTLFPDLPELGAAAEQAYTAQLRDALSGLYVAMTRARHALHVVVKPDGKRGMGSAKTSTRILREALAPQVDAREGVVLYEAGDPDWFQRSTGDSHGSGFAAVRLEAAGCVTLRRDARRGRVLSRRSPSEMEGGTLVDLSHVLRFASSDALARGSIAHTWFEQIEWLEDRVPERPELMRLARAEAPEMGPEGLDALLSRFHEWLGMPAVRDRLSRTCHPGDVRVERELPFIRREGDALMEGIIDRLVLVREGGRIVGAEIVDFKTDRLAPDDPGALAQRVEHYRPQVAAYRNAVAEMYRLPQDRVRAALLFVEIGAAVEVEPAPDPA